MSSAANTASRSRTTSEPAQRPEDWGLPAIARYLNENLGPKLTAHLVGKDPQTVARWVKGQQKPPQDEVERKLRGAFQIFSLLVQTDSRHVVRAWFIGMNPQLEDRSPADVIADGDTRAAMVAARAFVTGG